MAPGRVFATYTLKGNIYLRAHPSVGSDAEDTGQTLGDKLPLKSSACHRESDNSRGVRKIVEGHRSFIHAPRVVCVFGDMGWLCERETGDNVGEDVVFVVGREWSDFCSTRIFTVLGRNFSPQLCREIRYACDRWLSFLCLLIRIYHT